MYYLLGFSMACNDYVAFVHPKVVKILPLMCNMYYIHRNCTYNGYQVHHHTKTINICENIAHCQRKESLSNLYKLFYYSIFGEEYVQWSV